LAVLNEENGFFERLLFSPQFESIAKSYGFGSDDDYPDWIKDALNCVVEKKHCKKYFDERDEVYNLFEHLLSDFNWPIENEGEWTLLVFPNSEMKLYISRDALNPQTGRGCSSWETESI
jgi:hypothetical protein